MFKLEALSRIYERTPAALKILAVLAVVAMPSVSRLAKAYSDSAQPPEIEKPTTSVGPLDGLIIDKVRTSVAACNPEVMSCQSSVISDLPAGRHGLIQD